MQVKNETETLEGIRHSEVLGQSLIVSKPKKLPVAHWIDGDGDILGEVRKGDCAAKLEFKHSSMNTLK